MPGDGGWLAAQICVCHSPSKLHTAPNRLTVDALGCLQLLQCGLRCLEVGGWQLDLAGGALYIALQLLRAGLVGDRRHALPTAGGQLGGTPKTTPDIPHLL